MDFESLKNIAWIAGTIISLLASVIGGALWLNGIMTAIKENRALREADKKELLKHIDDLNDKIDLVEKDSRQTIASMLQVFTDIRERLSSIEAKIEMFIKTKI
jgi:tellurite resistance protein